MLVLTRKTQEKIQVGENITITILKVKGRSVRVGIDAPRDVRVVRSEIPLDKPVDTQDDATEAEHDEVVKGTTIHDAVSSRLSNEMPPAIHIPLKGEKSSVRIARRFRIIIPDNKHKASPSVAAAP